MHVRESRDRDVCYVSASQTNLPPSAQRSENHLQPASRGKSGEAFFLIEIAASAEKKKKNLPGYEPWKLWPVLSPLDAAISFPTGPLSDFIYFQRRSFLF